jgi:2-isopropylmalate synthase
LEGAELESVFVRFKEVADRKKNLTDADLEALVVRPGPSRAQGYRLESLQVACGTAGLPVAAVRVRDPEGEVASGVAAGKTPLEAVLTAITEASRVATHTEAVTIHAMGPGPGSPSEVSVRVRPIRGTAGALQVGRSRDLDLFVAGARAYLEALSHLAAAHEARNGPKRAVVVHGGESGAPME